MCLALGGTIGMTVLILACALSTYNWWPFFVVMFYVLSLLPRFIVRVSSATSAAHRDASMFFAIGMILSSFALPIVLARSSVILNSAAYLVVGANIVNFFTLAMYFKMTEAEEDAYMGNF